MTRKYNHYFKNVAHLEALDVYRVLQLFGVTDPCLQHAIKKLLCAGVRGVKDQSKDIQEAIDALNRSLEMQREDDMKVSTEQVTCTKDLDPVNVVIPEIGELVVAMDPSAAVKN